MKLSIIIPAYNEERTVAQIIKRVDEIDLGDIKKEIVVIDDGSSDKTFAQIKSIEKDTKSLIPIHLKKNRGKGSAISIGLKKTTGDIVIIQDADLEYNPFDIPRLIKPIVERKAQVVYGTRLKVMPVFFGKNKTPYLTHFFGNKLLSFLTTILYGYPISDMETGYKAFRREVLDGIKVKAKSFDFEPEITAKVLKKHIRILEIPIKTKPRSYKEGKKLYWHRDGFIALWTLLKYKFTN